MRWLSIELTYRCQNQCKWCYNPFKKLSVPELSEEVWRRAIIEAADLGTEVIIFTGGEPLLIPYLSRLIDLSSDLGILTGLVTNGELRDNYPSLIESGLSLVWISILGPCSSVNDAITCKYNSFNHKIKAFRTLRQFADEHKILLMANMVVEPMNYSYVYDTLKILSNEGVMVAYVEEVVNAGHAKLNPFCFLNEGQRRICLYQIKKSKNDFPSLVTITRTLDRPFGKRNPPPPGFLNITPDGFLTETESGKPKNNLSILDCSLKKLINGF